MIYECHGFDYFSVIFMNGWTNARNIFVWKMCSTRCVVDCYVIDSNEVLIYSCLQRLVWALKSVKNHSEAISTGVSVSLVLCLNSSCELLHVCQCG